MIVLEQFQSGHISCSSVRSDVNYPQAFRSRSSEQQVNVLGTFFSKPYLSSRLYSVLIIEVCFEHSYRQKRLKLVFDRRSLISSSGYPPRREPVLLAGQRLMSPPKSLTSKRQSFLRMRIDWEISCDRVQSRYCSQGNLRHTLMVALGLQYTQILRQDWPELLFSPESDIQLSMK